VQSASLFPTSNDSSETPLVFTPPTIVRAWGSADRLFALALTLIAPPVLVLAVVLKPSPQGVGTHRQMRFLAAHGGIRRRLASSWS